ASYTGLNRFDEAQGAINDAFARQLDDPVMHENLYTLDFLRGDTTKLEHEIALSAGKPGWEDLLLSLHSNTAAFHGRINDARSLSRRAADAAHRADLKEPAALWLADAALREAAFGNRDQVRQFATE